MDKLVFPRSVAASCVVGLLAFMVGCSGAGGTPPGNGGGGNPTPAGDPHPTGGDTNPGGGGGNQPAAPPVAQGTLVAQGGFVLAGVSVVTAEDIALTDNQGKFVLRGSAAPTWI